MSTTERHGDAPTDAHGVASAAEQDRRIQAIAQRNGQAPVTIRRVGDPDPERRPERKPKPKRAAKLTASERVRIHDMRAQNLSYRQIADATGRSIGAVQNALKDTPVATHHGEAPRRGQERARERERAAKPEHAIGPPPVIAQALAILDSELERLDALRDVRDRLARLAT